MNQIEGIIFDLDGTLLDTMEIWNTVGNDYLISLGIEPRENLAEVFKEMSLKQSAEYYQRVYGVDKTIEEIISGINGVIESFYIERVQLKDGVKEFLETLSEQDVKMCIATATDRYLVETALMRLGVRDYFQKILTCNEVGYGKDSPVIFEQALEILGTSKEHTYVFEDALHAVKTAKQAGFQIVGVYDASEPEQEEVKKLSDMYVLSFQDIHL